MYIVRRELLRFADLPGRISADPFADVDADVSVRIVRIAPVDVRRPHRHPHSAEVVHILSGTGSAWQDGTRHPVGPGDTILVPQGVAHATLADPGSELEMLCFFAHPQLSENIEELDGPELTTP